MARLLGTQVTAQSHSCSLILYDVAVCWHVWACAYHPLHEHHLSAAAVMEQDLRGALLNMLPSLRHAINVTLTACSQEANRGLPHCR